MFELLVTHQEIMRLSAFIFFFLAFALIEFLFSYRSLQQSKPSRWLTAFILLVLSAVFLKLLPFIGASASAIFAKANGVGVLNLLDIPFVWKLLASLVVLDLLIYWQHRAFHLVPVFWRFHRVHHADRDFDVSTAIRFHPIEIVISMIYKSTCVLVLGCPIEAVILFDMLLNASAIYTHSNIGLPTRVDNFLRKLLVTPNMHRIHHSAVECETNSNYGFFLAIWDRIFGSYIAKPENTEHEMMIGLKEFQDEKPNQVGWSLALPFRK